MTFEYIAGDSKGSLLAEFAGFRGVPLINYGITVPADVGHGQVRGHGLNGSLKIMTHRTRFREDLVFRRVADKSEDFDVAFTFHWYLKSQGDCDNSGGARDTQQAPYVHISSANIDYETVFKSDCINRVIIIVLNPKELISYLGPDREDHQIHNLLPENATYFYDEVFTLKMQEVANQLIDAELQSEISDFFLEVKARELIYLVLASMLFRQDQKTYPINRADLKSLYLVRDKIITDLSVKPNFNELSILANMSVTKLSRLFRQIFGYSIYDYYLRMKVQQAADMIKRENCSVSEAGYSMGFTNLSHFSRIFERYVGVKPKKYSMTEMTSPTKFSALADATPRKLKES